MAALRATVPGTRDLSWDVEMSVADRRWRLQVQAEGRRLPGGSTSLPLVVALAGAAFGLLLAGLVYALASGRARAQAQVEDATSELATAEADARQQADLLSAVMDSISDGVGVVDTHGEFLLHNPAARAMLGLDETKAGPEHWQEHYGIYLPDGVTPFPTSQLPLIRALAGRPPSRSRWSSATSRTPAAS